RRAARTSRAALRHPADQSALRAGEAEPCPQIHHAAPPHLGLRPGDDTRSARGLARAEAGRRYVACGPERRQRQSQRDTQQEVSNFPHGFPPRSQNGPPVAAIGVSTNSVSASVAPLTLPSISALVSGT